MRITRKGNELSAKLAPAIGWTHEIAETCSLICRAAATLQRLAEEDCNGHPAQSRPHSTPEEWAKVDALQARWDARIERETRRVTARFIRLVESLPETDAGPFKPDPVSDPRGCSIIIAPEGSGIHGDSWGDRNGVCVP